MAYEHEKNVAIAALKAATTTSCQNKSPRADKTSHHPVQSHVDLIGFTGGGLNAGKPYFLIEIIEEMTKFFAGLSRLETNKKRLEDHSEKVNLF